MKKAGESSFFGKNSAGRFRDAHRPRLQDGVYSVDDLRKHGRHSFNRVGLYSTRRFCCHSVGRLKKGGRMRIRPLWI